MNAALKSRLVPLLFAISGLLFLVPVIKDAIQGEPVRTVFLVIALMFFVFAVVFVAVWKSGGGSR